MSELNKEHFDEMMRSLAKDLQNIQATQGEHTTSLRQIDTRLGAIETILWQGQRIDEISKRIVELANATGHTELAGPFIAAPGMAAPTGADAR